MSLDDPVYDRLEERELAGDLPPFRGGLGALTRARIHELVPDAPALPAGWWIRPIDRGAVRVEAVDEAARTYTTASRARSIAGVLALSCERQEGRPCGDGLGVSAELDAAGGHGAWIAGAVRLRAESGTAQRDTALAVDRAYVNAEIGPLAAEIGRDVLAVGPSARTQIGWSTNAPALDHVRLSTARPLVVWPRVRASAVYVLGRLAEPQTYPGNLVSIARAQLDVGDRFALGAMQLLQLGGDGAPGFGPWGFVLEHIRRRDPSASASDSSNRRVGIDVAAHLPVAGGARITYQLIFEDLRKEIASAVRHDADHVVGIQLRWLTAEWRKTGVRSYEHMPRITGFTSRGRIVGDPLGPAAQAGFVGARIPVRCGVVLPWVEVAGLSSATYEFPDPGPVTRTGGGITELRFRVGARARVPVGRDLGVEPEAAFEHVERASFMAGARHTSAVFAVALLWRPSATRSTFTTSATSGAR